MRLPDGGLRVERVEYLPRMTDPAPVATAAAPAAHRSSTSRARPGTEPAAAGRLRAALAGLGLVGVEGGRLLRGRAAAGSDRALRRRRAARRVRPPARSTCGSRAPVAVALAASPGSALGARSRRSGARRRTSPSPTASGSSSTRSPSGSGSGSATCSGRGCSSRSCRSPPPARSPGCATVVALITADMPRDLLEIDGTLDYPLGYRNANAAFFAIALFPAVGLAADRELDWRLRGLALGTATLCIDLVLLIAEPRLDAGDAGRRCVVFAARSRRCACGRWPGSRSPPCPALGVRLSGSRPLLRGRRRRACATSAGEMHAARPRRGG